MRSMKRRLDKLEGLDSKIRYIVVHNEVEAAAYHRWSVTQPPFSGTTYIVHTGVPPADGAPLPPWLQ